MRQPAHGYMIAKVLGNIIGPIAKPSNGRIYPLLTKLEEQRLIRAVDQVMEGRMVRTFHIEEMGRKRFRELVLDTASNPREYQEVFSFKVTIFPLIEPEERLFLIDHYIHHCQAHILHLRNGVRAMQEEEPGCEVPGTAVGALAGVLAHRCSQWELELTWARSLREVALHDSNRRRDTV